MNFDIRKTEPSWRRSFFTISQKEEKKMAIFTGAGVAIVTPFKENREVDYEKFAETIEFQIANNTVGIIVCGTTGEGWTL